MGSLLSAFDKEHLVVTTINYSGILLSPFEFYSEEHLKQEVQLSTIFEKLLYQQFKQFNPATFKWGLGKIDQKMQKQRYSPLYNSRVGVQNSILLNQKQFKEKWTQVFKARVSEIEGLECKEQEIERCKTFDFMCYKAILILIFKVNDIQAIDKKQINPFINFMDMFFDKAFLKEQKKIAKTLAAIEKQKVDIMFFQEANKRLVDAIDLKQFKVVSSQGGQSLIFIRRKTFKKIHDENKVLQTLGPQIREALNWNKDTAIAFVDNLILFSGHLSSKKEKNPQQVRIALESLQKMKQRYPNEHIIVGLDANSFISQIPSFLKQYPNHESQFTTLKKRTYMQPQVNKANQIVKASRDVLLTDLNLRKPRVVSILDRKAEEVGFIPCEEHPYDHFVVTAYLDPREE